MANQNIQSGDQGLRRLQELKQARVKAALNMSLGTHKRQTSRGVVIKIKVPGIPDDEVFSSVT